MELRAAHARRADGVSPARRVRRRLHARAGAGRCRRRADRPLGGAGPAGPSRRQVTGDRRRRRACRATGCSRRCALLALEKLADAGETPALLRRHAEALLAFLLPLRRSSDGRRGPSTRSVSARKSTTCGPRSAGPNLQRASGRSPARCSAAAAASGWCMRCRRRHRACAASCCRCRPAWRPRSRRASTCCWVRSAIAARAASAFLPRCARRSCTARWAILCG